MTAPLIALIDGPVPDAERRVFVGRDAPPDPAQDSPAARHAQAMQRAILAAGPARILNLVVFDAALSTDADRVARALRMAADAGAAVALCALGLPRPDPGIGAGVAALLAQGAVVVAASPARGGPVWPAAFAGVASVQGDARCGSEGWSRLGPPLARFGACPGTPGAGPAGASVAAAHFAGIAARRLDREGGDALAALDRDAPWQGRERRRQG